MFVLEIRKKTEERADNTYFSVETLFPNQQKLSATLIQRPRPKILSIDASKVCQKINVTLLKRLNCSVVSAETASMALTKLASSYRIIFLDANLPDLHCELFIHFIRYSKQSLNKDTPIIVTANWLEERFKKNCFFMGINRVFIKPITMKNFRYILQQYDAFFPKKGEPNGLVRLEDKKKQVKKLGKLAFSKLDGRSG